MLQQQQQQQQKKKKKRKKRKDSELRSTQARTTVIELMIDERKTKYIYAHYQSEIRTKIELSLISEMKKKLKKKQN